MFQSFSAKRYVWQRKQSSLRLFPLFDGHYITWRASCHDSKCAGVVQIRFKLTALYQDVSADLQKEIPAGIIRDDLTQFFRSDPVIAGRLVDPDRVLSISAVLPPLKTHLLNCILTTSSRGQRVEKRSWKTWKLFAAYGILVRAIWSDFQIENAKLLDA